MVTQTTALPPEIRQHFNALLLSTPMPQLSDSLKLIWRMYLHIKRNLMKKTRYNENMKRNCEKMEKEFLELYERAKIKKEKLGEDSKNQTEELFYHVRLPNRSFENIFFGLRKASYRIS